MTQLLVLRPVVWLLVPLAVLVIELADSSAARAQSASSPAIKLPLARRLHDEGVEASDRGQWSIAHDRFKASYELAPRTQTLFNLASAQSQTGRLVEAMETYRKFLRESNNAELKAQASSQLELVERQLAHVTIDVTNLAPGDAILVDDVELPASVLRQPIAMNPGSHVTRIQRGNQVIASHTVALASGATQTVRIDLPVKPVDVQFKPPVKPAIEPEEAIEPKPLPPGPRPDEPPSGGSWLRSPWLWSGVAVVLAGTAAGTYLLTRPDGVVIH